MKKNTLFKIPRQTPDTKYVKHDLTRISAYKWSATSYTTFTVSCVDVGGLYVL